MDVLVRLMRRCLRLTAYLLINLIGMPVQLLAFVLAPSWLERIPLTYHRLCMRLFGIQVVTVGAMVRERPVLFVVNHVSYLDIPVLASVIPGSFVAKQEVSGWPLFGWLAKLQRTVFVSRRAQEIGEQNNSIKTRLGAMDNLIVFPEGTNTDGNRVEPFRTSVFQVAVDYARERPLVVQPVSINLLALEGVSAGRSGRQIYSWYGASHDLAGHLWRFMGFANSVVRVEFHSPLDPRHFADRKALAAAAEAAVRGGIAAANGGRDLPPIDSAA